MSRNIAKVLLITGIVGGTVAYASDDETDLSQRLELVEKEISLMSTQIGHMSKLMEQEALTIQKLANPARPPSREESIKMLVGKTVPLKNLSQLSAEGEKVPLDMAGHETAVLTVMRTGCHFCQQETPDLAVLDTLSHQSGNALVLPVFGPENPTAISEFLTKYGWKDARPAIMSGSLNVPINGTPTTLIIDKTGKISKAYIGVMSPDDLAEVKKLVAAPAGEKGEGE
jgi:hypothetical protein